MTGGGLSFEPALNSYYDASLNLQRVVEHRTLAEIASWELRRRAVSDSVALAEEQMRVRHAVERGIGGLVEIARAVRWETRGRLRGHGFTVERVLYWSAERVIVSALLYRPDPAQQDGEDSAAKRGAVFVACGHWPDAKSAVQYQRLCQSLARAGLVVLIADPIGQGERSSYLSANGPTVDPGVVEHTYAGVQCWWNGESPARYFVRDASAGISLLAELNDVDESRIGVTGDSGGGTLTTLLMALEPRLAAAVPVTYVTSRGTYILSGQPQDAEQILLGGTESGVDHADLLLCMAPRPALVLAAEYDFFPIEGTAASVASANRALDACGHPEIGLMSWPVMHEYTPEMVTAATSFFSERLGNGGADLGRDANAGFAPFESAELQVTDSGQVLVDFPDVDTIFTSTSARLAAAHKPSEDEALAWLRMQVVERRTHSVRTAPRWFPVSTFGGLRARQGWWYAEDGVLVAGIHVSTGGAPRREVTIVLRPQGTHGLSSDDELWSRVTDDRDLLVLDTRAAGALAPHELGGLTSTDMFAASYKLGCDLLWLGDSLGAGRVFDVMKTVELCRAGLLPENPRPTAVDIHGIGLDSLTALSAALLDEAGASVSVSDFAGQEAIFNTRDYDVSGAPWRQMIPGFAQHFDTDRIVTLLGGRLAWERDTS